MSYRILFAFLLLIVMTSTLHTYEPLIRGDSEPLYLIIIWHYHQPWYYSEDGTHFILPWVRLHSVGNYYKMAYILSKYPSVKSTFTFSGSLLLQIEAYLNGTRDSRQILSLKVANGENLTSREIYDIVKIPGGFFDISWRRVVDVVPRYRELRDKAQRLLNEYRLLPDEEKVERIAQAFTEEEIVDIVAMFNLFWIDPQVLREEYPELHEWRSRALSNGTYKFTREQIMKILDAHLEIMNKITRMYSDLVNGGQVELIPVPYSHPLAAIMADLGWYEDVYIHVNKSIDIFKRLFNYTPRGVWPAEQAINQHVIDVFSCCFDWSVSDIVVLGKSGVDISDLRNKLSLWYTVSNTYSINNTSRAQKKFYMLFRDTELSDRIGFWYSGWDTETAVNDLVNALINYRNSVGGGYLLTIALDGENPWEHYVNWGDDFLNRLYEKLEELQAKQLIRTITPSEYISNYGNYAREIPIGPRIYLDLMNKDISDIPLAYYKDAYTELPRRIVETRLGEGSWSGGEVAVWIGSRDENAAWMWLVKAREDLLSALGTNSTVEAMAINEKAVENLLRAQASDWTFWYGGEFGGLFPANTLYKA